MSVLIAGLVGLTTAWTLVHLIQRRNNCRAALQPVRAMAPPHRHRSKDLQR